MAPSDEFGDLLGQIQTLTTQLATIISKSEYLTRDIASLCADRKETETAIADMKSKIAVLETKAEYASKACEDVASKILTVQEMTWKQAGMVAGIALAVDIIAFGILILFKILPK